MDGSSPTGAGCHHERMDAAVNPILDAVDRRADTTGAASTDHVLVRVISLNGFGLRDAGDGAVISRSDGSIAGSMLGGLADPELSRAVIDDGSRRPLRVTVTDREADAAGMVCGGAAHLLLSPVADLPSSVGPLLRQAQPLALVARADGVGTDLVVTRKEHDGSIDDVVDPHLDEAVAAARAQLSTGSTATSTVEVAGVTLVVSSIVPATRLLIVGSGPMAEAIAAQGRLMGWSADIDESVDAGVAFVRDAGPADAVAVLSHDADVDVPVLDAALRSSIGYIGGMGSRGTQSRRRRQLIERGHGDADVDRIHGPIGLDLGSRTPAETAVAIAAEFLANRSGRRPGSLKEATGSING